MPHVSDQVSLEEGTALTIDQDIRRALALEPVRKDDFAIALTTSCRDSDSIPKVPNAGGSIIVEGTECQIMHNGLRVVHGGYYGNTMAKIIEGLSGHHEPQEELVFHHILKFVPPRGSIIELGCYWAYYALWFLKEVEGGRALGIEPDPHHIDVGKKNASLNNLPLDIRQGYIAPPGSEGPFQTEYSGAVNIPALSPAAIISEFVGDGILDILHCDTQGAEVYSIEDCYHLFESGKVRFALFSTHAMEITGSPLTHQSCLQMLKECGGRILAEHDVHESYSGDGLIAVYFGKDCIEFPKIDMSYNRYGNSKFANPIIELARLKAKWGTLETPSEPSYGDESS